MFSRKCAVFCALLLAFAAPAPARGAVYGKKAPAPVNELKHVVTEGGQHPDAHIDGFVLNSAFVHVQHKDGSATINRRMIQFDDHPHRHPDLDPKSEKGRKLLQADRFTVLGRDIPYFSSQTNSRDRVITLAKLNLLAYDRNKYDDFENSQYPRDQMEKFLSEGESIFGPDILDHEDEYEASEKLYNLVQGQVNTAKEPSLKFPKSTSERVYWPETQINDDGHLDLGAAGIAALEFKRWSAIDNLSVTVLVFRGTVTSGDRENVVNWVHDFVTNGGMTKRMKEMWVDEAKLEWTEKMEDRTKQISFYASAATCIYNDMFDDAFSSEVTVPKTDYHLESVEYYKTGYWGVTKQLVDKSYSELNMNRNNDYTRSALILTGHSQGGTRAALASMYMKKKKNLDITTVTFGSTGPQCMARLLHSNYDMLDDVDPYVNHPQITEYVHYLDPWGQALGRENGNVCLYGKIGLETSEAKKGCERVWGTPGVKLWFNEGADKISWKKNNAQNKELYDDFSYCRYRTHWMDAMLLDLQRDGVLDTNGVSDGGCALAAVADKDDTTNMCSLEDSPCVKHIIAFSFFMFGLVACLTLCCFMCWRPLCCPYRNPAPSVPQKPRMNRGPPVPYFNKPVTPPPQPLLVMQRTLPVLGPLVVSVASPNPVLMPVQVMQSAGMEVMPITGMPVMPMQAVQPIYAQYEGHA